MEWHKKAHTQLLCIHPQLQFRICSTRRCRSSLFVCVPVIVKHAAVASSSCSSCCCCHIASTPCFPRHRILEYVGHRRNGCSPILRLDMQKQRESRDSLVICNMHAYDREARGEDGETGWL